MDIGLTKQQKDAVKRSWGQYQSNGIANGSAFYLSWFKTDPEAFSYFKPLFKDLAVNDLNNHPKLRAQVKVFNDALASFVDSLDDGECLTVLVQKLAKGHFSKGLRMKEFHDAFGQFIRFLQEAIYIDGATKEAWEKTVIVICRIMTDHMQELS